jgi:hypothetical protein
MACYLQAGHYDERFRQLPDYLMWLRILKNWDIHVMSESLIKFRIHENQMNESAPTPAVVRRCQWESIQIYKEIMSLNVNDFRYLVESVLPDLKDTVIDGQPREVIFAKIALHKQNFLMIESAIQLLYELTPEKGSGGSFHELKLPSVLATLIQHAGLYTAHD